MASGSSCILQRHVTPRGVAWVFDQAMRALRVALYMDLGIHLTTGQASHTISVSSGVLAENRPERPAEDDIAVDCESAKLVRWC